MRPGPTQAQRESDARVRWLSSVIAEQYATHDRHHNAHWGACDDPACERAFRITARRYARLYPPWTPAYQWLHAEAQMKGDTK
jgi:hypothetical protein